MRNAIRGSLAAAGLSAALALAGAPAAKGQVFFRGNVPVPHGRIIVGVGVPEFAVGTEVPAPYVNQIVDRPGYGYGFSCEAGWIPVRSSYGGRWIVSERSDRIGRVDRDDRRLDRRFDRDDRRFERRGGDRDRDHDGL